MKLKLNWGGTKERKGSIEGEALNAGLTVPDYYTGEEPGTNPKELLVSSLKIELIC